MCLVQACGHVEVCIPYAPLEAEPVPIVRALKGAGITHEGRVARFRSACGLEDTLSVACRPARELEGVLGEVRVAEEGVRVQGVIRRHSRCGIVGSSMAVRRQGAGRVRQGLSTAGSTPPVLRAW